MFAENYEETQHSKDELLKLFLSAKQVEGDLKDHKSIIEPLFLR